MSEITTKVKFRKGAKVSYKVGRGRGNGKVLRYEDDKVFIKTDAGKTVSRHRDLVEGA